MVFVCSNAWMNRSGTAVIRPNAVQFIASEMLADSRFAFSAGFTVATARERVDQTADGAEQAEQRREVRERREVVRALLEAAA